MQGGRGGAGERACVAKLCSGIGSNRDLLVLNMSRLCSHTACCVFEHLGTECALCRGNADANSPARHCL